MNKFELISGYMIDSARKNSPKILLGAGLALELGAIVASSSASFKAHDIIKDIHEDPKRKDKKWLTKEYALNVIPLYIPVAILAGGSAVCLIKSYDINAKRLAAATALAEVSMETLRIYKDKARKALGEEKVKELEKEVKEEQEKIDIQKRSEITDDPSCDIQWFKDELTQQEFLCTKENIVRANLDFSTRLQSEMMISVNEWIDILNDWSFKCNDGNYQLQHVLDGDDRGWECGYPIYIDCKKPGLTSRGKSCLILEYSLPPRTGYRYRY